MFDSLRADHLEYALRTLKLAGYKISPNNEEGKTEAERRVDAFKAAAVMLYDLKARDFEEGSPWSAAAKIVQDNGFQFKVLPGLPTLLASEVLGAMRCAAVIHGEQ